MLRICDLLGTANTKWLNGTWPWGECQQVTESCVTWGNANYLWQLANWKQSECSSSIPQQDYCKVWITTPEYWIDAYWLWSECTGSIPVITIGGNQPGVDAETLIQPWQIETPWNPYISGSVNKQKRMIKLICRVNNTSYSEEKEVGTYKLMVNDVKMIVNSLPKLSLTITK